jgi:hypothetical protein
MAERRAMLRMQFLLHPNVILTRVLVSGAGLEAGTFAIGRSRRRSRCPLGFI